MQYMNTPLKPLAPNPDEQDRWSHTSLRKRMIIGAWEQDLEDELARHLPQIGERPGALQIFPRIPSNRLQGNYRYFTTRSPQ